jgi:hypothetical protein
VTELDLDPLPHVDPTLLRIMIDAAHPVDIALVVMVTAIEAHRAVPTTMTTVVVVIDLLPELVDPSMTTHLNGAVLMILTAVTTHLIHTLMAELPMTDLHRGITPHGMPHTEMTTAVADTGRCSLATLVCVWISLMLTFNRSLFKYGSPPKVTKVWWTSSWVSKGTLNRRMNDCDADTIYRTDSPTDFLLQKQIFSLP